MGKTLVAYYSWSGHTRQIAEAIAEKLGADVEPIREVKSRSGWMAYLRSAWEALLAKPAPIAAPEKDPSAYDLVVLGTPVWAGRMSSPLRSYLLRERDKFTRVAVFCTEGGASGEQAMQQVAQLCGKEPVATLIVKERDLNSGDFANKVADFVSALG